MKEGSMLEAANRALVAEGKSMKFPDLWKKVKEELEITEAEEGDRIGHFYTDLSLSGQFVVLGENVWDLRSRHTYDKVHIEMDEVYKDVEQKDDDATDQQEEAEYNQSVRGGELPVEEESSETEESEGESKPRENLADLGIPGDNF